MSQGSGVGDVRTSPPARGDGWGAPSAGPSRWAVGPGQAGPPTGSWGWRGGRRRVPPGPVLHTAGLSAAHPPRSLRAGAHAHLPPPPQQAGRPGRCGRPEQTLQALRGPARRWAATDPTALGHQNPPLPRDGRRAPKRAWTRAGPTVACGEPPRKHPWVAPRGSWLGLCWPPPRVSSLSPRGAWGKGRAGLTGLRASGA